MEVLCSDKTGTLTKNELSISNPVAYVGEVRTPPPITNWGPVGILTRNFSNL